MGVRKIVGMTVLGISVGVGMGVGILACASDGGSGTPADEYGTRLDASDFVADDGAVLGESTMIDDLEDGDGAINEIMGRIGSWYAFNDGTGGTMSPAESADSFAGEGGARGSLYAAHLTGKGWKEWGAGLGLDLNDPGPATPTDPDLRKPYDASMYTGIAFEAKGNVPLRVSVAEIATIETTEGGTCVKSEEDGKMCDDTHGKKIALGKGWKTYELPFSDLHQEGQGLPAALDLKTLTGLQFQVDANLEFDFSVDNVRFY
jgi:hypothetical protein